MSSRRRKSNQSFVQLRHDIMNHDNFIMLSAIATKLLIDLISQYNGFNNGDLCASWSVMKNRGWRSRGTLNNALKELKEKKWIVITRYGGKHKASLYGVTWLRIDKCAGKLDVPSTLDPCNSWKKIESLPKNSANTVRQSF